MADMQIFEVSETDLEENLTLEAMAEILGARPGLILHLARLGVIEPVEIREQMPIFQRRTIVRIRRMQRLRRDLGVNFTGAAIILDLTERLIALEHLRAA